MLLCIIPIVFVLFTLLTVVLIMKKMMWALVCASCFFALNWWTDTVLLSLFKFNNRFSSGCI